MSTSDQLVLVFGATGRQGGAVTRALLDMGWSVRALVRTASSSSAEALRQAGAELVEGSFTDEDAVRAAMQNVHGVFSALPGDLPDGEEVRIGCAIADAAVVMVLRLGGHLC